MRYYIANCEALPINWMEARIIAAGSFQEALEIFERMKITEKACLIFAQKEPDGQRREIVSFRRVIISDGSFPQQIDTRQLIVNDMPECEYETYKDFYQGEADRSRVVEIGELKGIFINGKEGSRSWTDSKPKNM